MVALHQLVIHLWGLKRIFPVVVEFILEQM